MRGNRGRGGRGGGGGGGSFASRISGPGQQSQQFYSPPSSRNGPTHQQNNNNSRQQNLLDVQFTGWLDTRFAATEDRGLSSFLKWVERKAQGIVDKEAQTAGTRPHTLRIPKHRTTGNMLVISVHPSDVKYYQKLDGYTWSTAVINVHVTDAQAGPAGVPTRSQRNQNPQQQNTSFSFGDATADIKAQLQGVLSRRYDADNKILNLTNICAEPEFQNWGGSTLYDHPKLVKALCAMCEDAFKTPEERAVGISGIQLAGNVLGSLNVIRPLIWTFPDLLNLDLSNNNITKVDQLASIRKYTKLQHIILTGNPVEQHNPEFRNTLIRWFPHLKIIDTTAISEAEAAAAKGTTKEMPLKVGPGMYLDQSGIGENFLKEFFVRFDAERPQTANFYYDETSQFSLAVNTNSLREPGAEATTQRGEWSDWIRQSRNLLKLDYVHARKTRLHKGSADIARAFQMLPPTAHPPITESAKWVFECTPLTGMPDPNIPTGVNGLLITVHGELHEYPNDPAKRKLRSFDRTFTLGPNKTGGVRIVNDAWVLRNYGGTKAFPQNAGTVQSEEQKKTAMVAEVQRVTGMNAQYAELCLVQTGWKLEAALESFASVKASIPPEAFAS